MGSPNGVHAALSADWLSASRRAAEAARRALAGYPEYADRARETGRGEGGDMTLAIDRAVEDTVLAELRSFGVGVTVVTEERGVLDVAGGGAARVLLDPIDGSLNAKRGLRPYALSLAVASGDTMADVEFGYVADLPGGEEWWALHGQGAFHDGAPLRLAGESQLELLAVESARPELVADAGAALIATEARRLRMIGSIALSLCFVASGGVDAMVSLRPCRSIDAAAGQLIVREAGGTVVFPDAGDGRLGAGLDLDMRSRVVAAPTTETLDRLGALALAHSG
jgi:myo-inositol-1(or 4)-monophosphatase